MIRILWYEIVIDGKSSKIPFERIIKDKEELDELRKKLEKVNNCWIENKTITGTERKKVKDIMFTFKMK